LNVREVGIPTLILQPLVENAIIHGLAPMNESGELLIEFEKKTNRLVCKVIDNGIGYSKSLNKNLNGKKTSKAIQITKERIALENNYSVTNDFMIRDRLNSKGTEVVINLPLLNFW
jgi:LytS/YehU family sensor histidine kinase